MSTLTRTEMMSGTGESLNPDSSKLIAFRRCFLQLYTISGNIREPLLRLALTQYHGVELLQILSHALRNPYLEMRKRN